MVLFGAFLVVFFFADLVIHEDDFCIIFRFNNRHFTKNGLPTDNRLQDRK